MCQITNPCHYLRVLIGRESLIAQWEHVFPNTSFYHTWYFHSALWNHGESIRFILFFLYLCWSILWFPELRNRRKAWKAVRLFQARVLCLTDSFRRNFLVFVFLVPSWLLKSKDWTNCLMQRLCLTHTSVDAGHCRTYWSGRGSWRADIWEGGTLFKTEGESRKTHWILAERTCDTKEVWAQEKVRKA